DQIECVGFNRFLVKIVSAHGDCAQRIVVIRFTGHDNDFAVGGNAQNILDALEAFIHTIFIGRKSQVLDNHLGLMQTQCAYGVLAVLGENTFVFIKVPTQLALQSAVVFDDQ